MASFGNIYDDEDLRDPNRFKPDDRMMYAGENPELRQMMGKKPAAGARAAAFEQWATSPANPANATRTETLPSRGDVMFSRDTDGMLTDDERGAIAKFAGRGRDGTATVNGVNYIIPNTRTINSSKAQAYLKTIARQKAEREALDKKVADRDMANMQMENDQRRLEQSNQDKSWQLEQQMRDRRIAERNAEEDRRRRFEREDLGNSLAKARAAREIQDLNEAPSQASRGKAEYYRSLLSNPQLGPQARARVAERLAASSGVELDPEIMADLNRAGPEQQAKWLDAIAEPLKILSETMKTGIYQSGNEALDIRQAQDLVRDAARSAGVPDDVVNRMIREAQLRNR